MAALKNIISTDLIFFVVF